MKRPGLVLAGLSLALVGLLLVPVAKADRAYDLSVDLNGGNINGKLTRMVDPPFVTAGGTGSGAADSLVLTSIPAGFGTLAGGDVLSSWTDQVTDDFTVTSGVITSFAFFGHNFGGLSGVTFTPTSTVPEPGTSTLMLIGVGLLGLMMVMRKRNSGGHQLAA
jgi:hypothetical protein